MLNFDILPINSILKLYYYVQVKHSKVMKYQIYGCLNLYSLSLKSNIIVQTLAL